MLSLLFPGCLAARAKKSEVFLTNYASRVGVITSKSAHLIIRLPPISGYLTAKTNCLDLHIHRLYKCLVCAGKYEKKNQNLGLPLLYVRFMGDASLT